MFEFNKWKENDLRREKDSAEMFELLFPKPTDKAWDIAIREVLSKLERIMAEEPPPPEERTSAEMLALLFPARRAQAPAENISLFVERRRRPR